MATKKQPVEQDAEKKIEDALSKSGQFIENNSKIILGTFFGICIAVCAVFAYLYMYKAPRENQAAADMYKALEMYARDSFEVALNGNAEMMGLKEVADTYKGTPQANIANHTAGICYLNLGQYEDAIKCFEAFSKVSGTFGEIVSAQNAGLMGDAYVQLDQTDKGLAQYEKAAAISDNAESAPIFLFKAANINMSKGNCAKALEQYTKIRDTYPASPYSRNIEKYIAMAQQAL